MKAIKDKIKRKILAYRQKLLELFKKIFDRIMILLLVYPIGLLLAILFILFRFFGRIRIVHPERFPHNQGKIIIVSNHPSLLEPILLPVMCYRGYLRHPLTRIPISTPDKKNYLGSPYWHWLLKYAAVAINRENEQEKIKAIRKLVKILKLNGIVIIFGEGGRTEKGKDFFHSPKGKGKIRPLQEGISSLIRITNPLVVPLWVEIEKKTPMDSSDKVYFNSLIFMFFVLLWKKITIKIGEPLRFQRPEVNSREGITQKLITTLLNLADEEK